MVDFLMDALLRWIAERVLDLLGALHSFLTSKIFLSPDVTLLPQVQTIAGKSALVVDACFVLAIMAVGVTAMAGDSLELRYGLKQMLPRLVVGFVASAFAVKLTSTLITVANAVTVSMTGASAPTTQMVTFVKDRLEAAISDDSNSMLIVVIGVLIVALFFALSFGWLARIGVLVILAGLAPVALACYATVWTKGVADLWWRTTLGCLATPVLQAIAFTTGIGMLTDPGANLPIKLSDSDPESVNLMLVIVVLWATVRIPKLVDRYVTRQGSGGANVLGVIWRTAVVQGLTRSPGRRMPAQRVDASTHTDHHYRRMRNVYLNPRGET